MRPVSSLALIVFMVVVFAADSAAQLDMSVMYHQNFESMSDTGIWLPPSWRVNNHPSIFRAVRSWNDSDPTVSTVSSTWPIQGTGSQYSFNAGHRWSSTDRAVVIRPRPNVYSGSFVVWFHNYGNVPATSFTVSYDIEKYRKDTNDNGTQVALFYTYTPSANVPSNGFGSDPWTEWVKVDPNNPNAQPYPQLTLNFQSDPDEVGNQGESGGNDVPFPWETTPGWPHAYDPFTYPNSDPNPIIVSQPVTLPSGNGVPANGDLYVAIMFSIAPKITQGGGNAQNAQAFGLDNFSFSSDALPVELSTFSGAYRNGRIDLTWKTATEANNFGFDVERSVDQGSSWSTIGFVPGHGTVNTPQAYSFTDARNFKGLGSVSYRLRQVDRDGSFEYSQIINVTLSSISRVRLGNYPNPFNPTTSISFTLPEADVVSLRILDDAGREITTLLEGVALDAGTHSVPWTADGHASGNYHYELRTSAGVVTSQMSLMK